MLQTRPGRGPGVARSQEYANLALRRLKRPIAVHDLQVVRGLVHRNRVPPHEAGIHEGHAGPRVVEAHGLPPLLAAPRMPEFGAGCCVKGLTSVRKVLFARQRQQLLALAGRA